MDLSKILIFTIIIFLITGFAISYESDRDTDTDSSDDTRSTDDDDTTECEENPDSEACEDPDYADDQAEYIYDLDASWAFSRGSAPTNSGPSIFTGQKAGGEFEDGTVTFEQDKEGSIEEQYIENTGSADTDMWGRGTLTSTTIDITGSKVISGPAGEQLVTSPYSGQCGDGIPNTGDEVSCPEDWGTPELVVLDDQPSPERTIEYDYRGEISETFGDTEDAEDLHHEGEYNEESLDYHTDNEFIYRDEVIEDEDSLMGNTHYWYADASGIIGEEYSESDTDTEIYREDHEDATLSEERTFCTEIYEREIVYTTQPDMHRTVDTSSSSAESYEAVDNIQTGSIEAEISYNEDYDPGEISHGCDTFEDHYTECEEEDQEASCDSSTLGYHPSVLQTNWWVVYDSDWIVTYDKYDISRDDIWGPVNREPGKFDIDVVDSGFGYHSPKSSDSRQGSNDQSVSANRYTLLDDRSGSHTGSGSFESHREESYVANADGPDGGGNGLIAYNEVTGVEGTTPGVFESEYWDGSGSDYVSESDLPSISCPGDNSRCLVSIDVSTDQQGWSSASNSFSISID